MKPKQKKKYEVTTNRWNIVKNDKVRVIQGPSAGEEGIVTAVLRPKNRVIVEGCNMRRRTVAPQMDGTPGKMVVRACSIHYSNVMLVDPSNG
jgi:large subunit ribosomal protein L24